MEHSDKTILVTGATGQQGGAATRHLLEDGWRVRALAHHSDSPHWRRLEQLGVELVPGDLLDRSSLDRAVEGAYGVFSMQTPTPEGVEAEETEGKNLAKAAVEAGVRHFVYNSVVGADSDKGPGYVVSKHHIEEYIESLGLPATIWRPVTFMENYLGHRDEILNGHLRNNRWPESMQYLVAVDDVGRFVALAFRDPQRFIGITMAIAGDAMTMEDAALTFSETLGRQVEFEHIDLPNKPSPPRPAQGEIQPRLADVLECRRLVPDLASLGAWIEATGWPSLIAR